MLLPGIGIFVSGVTTTITDFIFYCGNMLLLVLDLKLDFTGFNISKMNAASNIVMKSPREVCDGCV